MSEWMPIESAPKDGAEFLGFHHNCGILLIRWIHPDAFMTEMEMRGMGEEERFSEGWFCADFREGGRLDETMIPIYWMPLPEPPK